MKTFTYQWSEELGAAIREAVNEPFTASFQGDEAIEVINAWNQGIDAYLEGFTESTHSFIGNRLYITLSESEVHILIRRLLESGDEKGIASGMCDVLGIELV